MFVLLSGEGATDIGTSTGDPVPVNYCYEPFQFNFGPMTIFADRIFQNEMGYSFLELGAGYGLVNRLAIRAFADSIQTGRPRFLRDKGNNKTDTQTYFYTAQHLATIATNLRVTEQHVIVVYFHDSDTQEVERIREAMNTGFITANFPYGVPMIPRPASESWLICALRSNPYQHCDSLEDESSTPNSANNLKSQLAVILGEEGNRTRLNLEVQSIDVNQITMPSFVAFRTRFEEVLRMPAPVTVTES